MLPSKAGGSDREKLELQVAAQVERQRRDIVMRCKLWRASHRCGPMYWLRNFTKTENYHWREMGLEPIMPFPFKPFTDREIDCLKFPFQHDFGTGEPCKRCSGIGFEHCVPDYLDVVMGLMLRKSPQLYIPKTREMMTSWLVTGYIVWACQFFAATQALSQSESLDKANGLIDYANILYRNQPDWLKNEYPLKRGTEGSTQEIEWAHGSRFTALPSGERKMASSHPSIYFMDEAAHIPAAEATINIAKPAVPQIIAVSSIGPGFFADECGC